MSKNTTLNDTVESAINITKDENFKDVIRYKAIAALLIKLTIPEFKDSTLIEISRAIIDTRERQENRSDTAVLEEEIDFLPTEAGTKDEKNTINDAIFRVNKPKSIPEITLKTIDKEITVNFEMQTSSSEASLGYNLMSRAVYYGASLLRDTVPAGDTKYTNIHKVYTVWFCKENIKFESYNEIGNRYIHRYGLRRFYDDITDKVVKSEKETDLIEVIMVELPKLKSNITNETVDMVYRLFFDTSNVIGMIEKNEKVNLTKIRKGVENMIDYEERTKIREDKAYKNGTQQGILEAAKNLINSMHREKEDIAYNKLIKRAELLLNLDKSIVDELNKEYL